MRRSELPSGTIVAVVVGTTGLLVSGWVHFYLYFRGGYRGIAPDTVLGLTISRSFALNAVAAMVIAEALVLSLRFGRLRVPATALAVGFAVATIVAYCLSRTSGLLGFSETTTSTEAVVALVAELTVIAVLAPIAIRGLLNRAHTTGSLRDSSGIRHSGATCGPELTDAQNGGLDAEQTAG